MIGRRRLSITFLFLDYRGRSRGYNKHQSGLLYLNKFSRFLLKSYITAQYGLTVFLHSLLKPLSRVQSAHIAPEEKGVRGNGVKGSRLR